MKKKVLKKYKKPSTKKYNLLSYFSYFEKHLLEKH